MYVRITASGVLMAIFGSNFRAKFSGGLRANISASLSQQAEAKVPWGPAEKRKGVDGSLNLTDYYDQVIGGDREWVPFPHVAAQDAHPLDDGGEVLALDRSPSNPNRLLAAPRTKFSTKLRKIAHKIGGTSLLHGKKRSSTEVLRLHLREHAVAALLEDVALKPGEQPERLLRPAASAALYSPRTQLIQKRVDERKLCDEYVNLPGIMGTRNS